MPVFARLLRRTYVALAELTWGAIVILFVAHFLLSWLLLSFCGESGLSGDPTTFFYFYVVTATTVGYGDLSPAGAAGRMVASLFVIPGAIAIFTAVLGKIIASVGGIWRKRMNGQGDYSSRSGHMIVLGFRGTGTRQLLDLLAGEHSGDEPLPVLIAKSIEKNPMPDHLDFVHTERLADPETLERAGLAGARAVLAQGENDDETLAAALVAATINPNAHIVAFFEYRRTAEIAARQAPQIETITSLSPELISRAARDPGSSRVAKLLLSASTEDTAFAMKVPQIERPVAYGRLLASLRTHCKATLVGIGRGGSVDLNCPDEAEISSGDVIYYICDHRLDAARVDWPSLCGAAR